LESCEGSSYKMFGPLAEDYALYRPGYPSRVLDELVRVCGLKADWMIADIGSGTGRLAQLFLGAGYQVAGVEPSHEMRMAAERLLAGYPAFCSLDGTAEHIPLEDSAVDLITVGQALHWFDADKAREEFLRILRPGGWVLVIWNDRLSEATAFTQDYNSLTQSWAKVQQPLPCPMRPFSTGLDRLFSRITLHTAGFPHTQRFNLEGLLGRARSSGHIPQPGALGHAERSSSMIDLFNRHECAGEVEFHYVTKFYLGQLDRSDSPTETFSKQCRLDQEVAE
jgi:SAM-dependent methyltransferase